MLHGMAEPDDAEVPPPWNSARYAGWQFRHAPAGYGRTLADLAAAAQQRREERKYGEPIDPVCGDEQLEVAWARDVRLLRDRCRIDIGPMVVNGATLSLAPVLPEGYEPRTSKREMFQAYMPEYMGADRIGWHSIATNIRVNQQPKIKGCFWDEGDGVMFRATCHALQLIAASRMPNTVSQGLKDRYEDTRADIRAERLEVHLSDAARLGSDEAVLVMTADGRITVGHLGKGEAIASTAFVIALGQSLLEQAILADYLLWWAWRLHSRSLEDTNPATYYAGLGCAKVAFAELAYIAAVILHEHVHFEIWNHCQYLDGSGTACPRKKMEVLGLGRFAALYGLTPTFTSMSSVTDGTWATLHSDTYEWVRPLADGVGRQRDRARLARYLDPAAGGEVQTLEARNIFIRPLNVFTGRASGDGTSGCDTSPEGDSYATTAFGLRRTSSVATLATPAACSKTGKNESIQVTL